MEDRALPVAVPAQESALPGPGIRLMHTEYKCRAGRNA